MASKPGTSFSESDGHGTDARTKKDWHRQRGRKGRTSNHWQESEGSDKRAKNHRGGYRHDQHRAAHGGNHQADQACASRGSKHYRGNRKYPYPGSNSRNDYQTQRDDWGASSGGYGSNNRSDFPRGRNRGGRRKGRGDYRQPRQSQCEDSSSQGAATSSFDIPGFYYDPEKKRYFKIQAGSEVRQDDETAVTKENITRKQAEVQRQKDLAALQTSSPARSAQSSKPTGKAVERSCCPSVSSLLLNGYQRGEVDRFKLHRALVLSSVPCLRQTGKCLAFSFPHNAINSQLEQMKHMEVSREHDKLLCLWSASGSLTERLQLINVKDARRTQPGELSLEFSPAPSPVLQSQNKITSVCWSDFAQRPDKKFVLYTSVCHTGQTHSLALIRCLDGVSQDQINCYDFDIGTKATWTCSWNYHKQQFAVGTERACLVIDVRTRRLWQFNTKQSDTLAHIFSKNDGGNVMYSGNRKGHILKHDLRSNSTFPVDGKMNHHTSVCCLRLSPEENYLYASDFSGKIKQWDVRMQKCVLCYDGLFNLHSKLPFHIDETQSLLYAGGQDCYTKLWCLKSGRLLHTIPPPYQASLYSIPAVQFSARWAGTGNVGLVMGAHNSFYLYGFQEEGE